MGATIGMIAIIGIGIIATMTTVIAMTIGTGIATIAMTATTGAIANPKRVQRRSELEEPAELWAFPAFL